MQLPTYRVLFQQSISLLALICVACSPVATDRRPAPRSNTTVAWSQGTFIQPPTIDDYTTSDRWEREFEAMKQVSMDLWIYQWTGDSQEKSTIYPTTIPGYQQMSSYDQVESALSMADRYGFKVFLGLTTNPDWWQKEGKDREWLLNEADQMNTLADELYRNYYHLHPQSFAGWYINWEMDNWAGYNFRADQHQNMIDALNTVSRHLDLLNPDLPSSIAPFFNPSGGMRAGPWGHFWQDILGQTSVDILMLQDGIGVGHASLAQLPAWYQSVCAGVRAAGKQCWSDLENFDGETPSPPSRLVDQHRLEALYVDRIITFTFNVYMSPEYGVDPLYYEQYKSYQQNARSHPLVLQNTWQQDPRFGYGIVAVLILVVILLSWTITRARNRNTTRIFPDER